MFNHFAGDSSGGNLAAAVSLKLRNEVFSPALKMQALIYPALQAVDFNTPSYQENACDPYLDRPWMMSFWMWYAYGNMPSSMLVSNTFFSSFYPIIRGRRNVIECHSSTLCSASSSFQSHTFPYLSKTIISTWLSTFFSSLSWHWYI